MHIHLLISAQLLPWTAREITKELALTTPASARNTPTFGILGALPRRLVSGRSRRPFIRGAVLFDAVNRGSVQLIVMKGGCGSGSECAMEVL